MNGTYEHTLAGITKDLSDLRANILGKLSREILALQSQRNRLVEEIAQLESQRQELAVRSLAEQGLQQHQLQRQLWIEQLAQAIAHNLRSELLLSQHQEIQNHTGQVDQLMLTLDRVVRHTFDSLGQDMEAYQQQMNVQLQRMTHQRDQGEMLLGSLVERIDEYLQRELPRTNGTSGGGRDYSRIQMPPITPSVMPAAPRARRIDLWWLGLAMVLGASVLLSFQNIVSRVIFSPSLIFGLVEFGGLIPRGVDKSLLVLFLRMVIATPMMWLLARVVFQVQPGRDVQHLLQPRQRLLMWRVLLSGLLTFASFLFAILAFAELPPAIATTVLFVFPTITVLLSWLLFGDRPTVGRWVVIGMIYVGVAMTSNVFEGGGQTSGAGLVYALLSGTCLAGYLITSQTCFKHLVPVSFTAINFLIVLGLCVVTLPFFGAAFGQISGALLGMSVLFAAATLGGYLLTNFGTKLMGAAQAAIISASGPVFTSMLAFVILGDRLNGVQVLGILAVTCGVGLLSTQSMRRQRVG
ncbi:MAG: EamA family transporter [Oscillatoriales cyanobacterium SM2_2_1]|nr:EamA family transporter [Oscillatoriales cyanobacterium SM2_2_1]